MEQTEIRVRGRVQGVGFRPPSGGSRASSAFRRRAQRRRGGADPRRGRQRRDRRAAGSDPSASRRRWRASNGSSEAASPARARRASASSIAPTARRAPRSRRTPRSAPHARARCSIRRSDAIAMASPTARSADRGFSIIRGIPYDRAATTMAPFALCARAAANTGTRRIGGSMPRRSPARLRTPRVGWCRPMSSDDAIDGRRALLRRGHIVAVKGLGGYQLACDATNAGCGVAAARREASRDQAVRADGARPGGHPTILRGVDARKRGCSQSRGADRAAARDRRRVAGRGGARV